MDYQMPIMNGIEAAQELTLMKHNNEISDIPIIACTAFNNLDDQERCYKSGMCEFLAKPINFNKVSQIVKK